MRVNPDLHHLPIYSYSKKVKEFLILFTPRVDLQQRPSWDALLLAEYTPMLTEKTKLYSRVQAMGNFTDLKHNRSYQYLRVGLEKKGLQFGIAVDFDAYGSELQYITNYGAFIRTTL